MLTETEVVKHFKAQPSELGLAGVPQIQEDNSATTLYPVGLEGLPLEVMLSVRKMRLSRQTSVVLNELLVQPERQVDQDQGVEVYKKATSTHLGTRPPCFNPAKRGEGRLLSARELKELGETIEERKRAAMEAMALETYGAQHDQEDDEFGGNSVSTLRPVVAAPTASTGSLAATSTAASTKKKGKPIKSNKRKAATGDDEEDDADQMSEGGLTLGTDVNMQSLSRVDPDMARVASKHASLTNRESPCFFNLDVKRFLKGEKLGKALQGVAWLCLESFIQVFGSA